MPLADAVLANDKYRGQLRSAWIASPADTTLAVTAVPTNVPTIVVVGWETQYETVFRVTGKSGTNSSNYALTGVTRLKGANANIPEGAAVNCLNNEEFFNQYAELLGEIQEVAEGAEATATGAAADVAEVAMQVASTTSSATPRPPRQGQRNLFELNAQAATAAFQPPTGTASDGDSLIVRIKDNGTARALTWDSATGGYVEGGFDLPASTVTGKYLHLGFQYVTSNSLNKWMLLGVAQEE